VLNVIHNPIVDRRCRRTLSEALGWNDADTLAAAYIEDVRAASHGELEYQVVARVERDGFPIKADGFRYDAETYLRCWHARRGFHEPDAVDYHALLHEFEVVERVNAEEIDEVWLFGFPWSGCYESLMVGPGAFWCNAPPLAQPAGCPRCRRRFVVMGFNYERDVDCMLEDLGHRTESTMAHVFGGDADDAGTQRRRDAASGVAPSLHLCVSASLPRNLWEHFTRYDLIAPGQASCGNVHFAPNSERDYDWGNPRPVLSDCDDWLSFPNLTGERRLVDCRDWGNGDMRLHHLWWLARLPHVAGHTDGVSNNWWIYIGDPNNV
jgi:hypothetical protein